MGRVTQEDQQTDRGGGLRAQPASQQERQLRHDIRHELATISLLASLIATSDDIGDASRARATQLVRELRWLGKLLQAYEDLQADPTTPLSPTERLRVDDVVQEVIAGLRLTHSTAVTIEASEVWTTANRLDVWRVLRNVIENAFRAAGPSGHVRVRVGTAGEAVMVQVDEDGPGFGAAPAGLASLGLTIVRDLLDLHCGRLVMATSDMGGGSVHVLMPAAPFGIADTWCGEDARAGTGL